MKSECNTLWYFSSIVVQFSSTVVANMTGVLQSKFFGTSIKPSLDFASCGLLYNLTDNCAACGLGSPVVGCRGVRVPLFSWFPRFWKFSGAKIWAFSFIFSLFLVFYPGFHPVFPRFLLVASHTSEDVMSLHYD